MPDMKRKSTRIFVLLVWGSAFVASAGAAFDDHDPENLRSTAPNPSREKATPDVAFQDYTDAGAFAAAAGGLTTITFGEVSVGTVLSNQYSEVTFIDGDDTTLADGGFINDGVGVQDGSGAGAAMTMVFARPLKAFALHFPGAATIDVYDTLGGTLLYDSADFGGSGTGFFGGVVSSGPSFSAVVVHDWFGEPGFYDDLVFALAPTPFQDYTDAGAFAAATVGSATITFGEVSVGTVLSNQYSEVTFIDGDDTTLADGGFINDGVGVQDGSGAGAAMTMVFARPLKAFALHFPGAATIDVYDTLGGTLLYDSADFGGSGTGFFGGVVSSGPSFSAVVVHDWFGEPGFYDDVVFEEYSLFADGFESGYTVFWSMTVP